MSRFGTFETTTTQEEIDFFGQWFEKEMMAPLLGSKTTLKTRDLGNGKMHGSWTNDKVSEMNFAAIFSENEPNKVDAPMFGGKATITYHATPKGYDSVSETEKYGKWEYSEEYCEEGFSIVTKKDGKSIKSFYKRVADFDGMYRVTNANGVKEYMKKQGMPDDICNAINEYVLCVKVCDQGMKMRESWGTALTLDFDFKFDEEFEYKFPVGDVPASKYVVSKAGFGKYTSVLKDANGIQEWTFCFNSCGGLKIGGKNMQNGDTCSMDLCKETCPIDGTWKVVSISGVKEMMTALNVPADYAEKFNNEIGITMDVSRQGPMWRMQWNSKLTPMDMSYKLNEEVTVFDPMFQENVKMVSSKGGNVFTNVTTSSKGTWISKSTVGNCFLVNKTWLTGMESMPMTYIMVRVC